MHMSTIGSDICFFHTVNVDGTLAFLASQAVAYLLYPLLGWLADVYFTRYRFILLSFITMILGTVLLIVSTALFLNFTYIRELFVPAGVSLIIGLVGMESVHSSTGTTGAVMLED